jgi:hypothetical protein
MSVICRNRPCNFLDSCDELAWLIALSERLTYWDHVQKGPVEAKNSQSLLQRPLPTREVTAKRGMEPWFQRDNQSVNLSSVCRGEKEKGGRARSTGIYKRVAYNKCRNSKWDLGCLHRVLTSNLESLSPFGWLWKTKSSLGKISKYLNVCILLLGNGLKTSTRWLEN